MRTAISAAVPALLLVACGAVAPADDQSEAPAALVADADRVLGALRSVHVSFSEQPYKDSQSTANLVLTPGGLAGMVAEGGGTAEVRVVGDTLYVHGVGLWGDYDNSGRLAAAIGTSWVRAPNIGQSSAEQLLEAVELKALRSLLKDFSPRSSNRQTVDGVASELLESESLTLAVTASAPHQPVLLSSLPAQPPSVGVSVHFTAYDDGSTVATPPDVKDVCELASAVAITLPGC